MSPSSWKLRFPALLGAVMMAAVLLSLTSPLAHGQLLQGSITGNVTDPTGAAVPDAEISLMNTNTGEQRAATSNASGQFNVPAVPAGTYNVTVTKEGFRAYIQEGTTVAINTNTRVDVTMQLGQVAEQITVAAQAATLQTDRAEVSAEVTTKTLENVPVPLGRNYQMLVATLPGVSQAENAHSVPSNPSRAVRFSVNGTSRSNNNTRIDGASQTNVWLPHMTAYVPSLEAVETVNVVSNSFDAEQGLAGGAAINLSIKSGTNDVHGSAYWYHNNQHLNARRYFGDDGENAAKFIYNQAGATIGGPIKKNKIFYFVSYEATREHTHEERIVDLPNAAMRAGDMTESPYPVFNPFTGDRSDASGASREPFAGNIIPQSMISETANIIINDGRWPLPNRPGSGTFGQNQNYLGADRYAFDRDTIDTKVTMNMSDKVTSFARFSYLDYRMDNPQVLGEFGGNRLHRTNSNPGKGFGFTASGTWSTTYVHSANLVFDGYFGATWQDTNVAQQQLDQNIGTDFLKIPGTNGPLQSDGGWPRLRIDGFEQLGISNNFQPYFRSDPQYQIVGNGNWTKGRHEIRFGTDLYWQELRHEQPEFSGSVGPASGGLRFREATTSQAGTSDNEFNAMSSFLLGLSAQSGRIIQWPKEYRTKTSLFSAYVRDRWQVNQKLTVTLGLRWEGYPFPKRDTRGLERFDFQNNKMLVCGRGSVPDDCGYSEKTNFVAPRLGLAYRMNDTTVIRAGYGITVDPFNWARPLRTNYPIMLVEELPQAHSRDWSTTTWEGFGPRPSEPTCDVCDMPLSARANAVNELAKRGYIQSWNLTLEKQLPGDWIVSAGYVATRSVRHMVGLDANWSDLGTGNAGKQLVQAYGRTAGTNYHGHVGTPKYDGLQTRAEKRFSGGLSMLFNYTWSHARGHGANDSGSGVRVDHPDYWNLNYGRLGYDYRHVFNATGIWEVPLGPGKAHLNSGVGAAILGGWQLNYSARISTGNPRTVTASTSSLNASGSGQFADCNGPIRYTKERTRWFDTSTFSDPNDDPVNSQRFGTCGNNTLTEPGLVNVDLGLFRQFSFTERVSLQFRAESFNISNTPHFSGPNTNVGSSNFGIITGVQNRGTEGLDQRIFRLGLRLGW
jgi:carboxypeptidase family protein/TonB-dependent receptor-like protein